MSEPGPTFRSRTTPPLTRLADRPHLPRRPYPEGPVVQTVSLEALPPHTVIVQTLHDLPTVEGIAVIRRSRRTLLVCAPHRSRIDLYREYIKVLHKCEQDLVSRCLGEPCGLPPIETWNVMSVPGWQSIYRAGEPPISLQVRMAQNDLALRSGRG